MPNPYLPEWEYIPDGEPRVFEYNGDKKLRDDVTMLTVKIGG